MTIMFRGPSESDFQAAASSSAKTASAVSAGDGGNESDAVASTSDTTIDKTVTQSAGGDSTVETPVSITLKVRQTLDR